MATGRATADDVAKAAGVSRATVSYVLNNNPHQKISSATRTRVLDAATALDYTPMASARSLSTGRSDVVVLLIPDWPWGGVIPEIFNGVARGLAPHGLEVLLHRCEPDRPVRNVWNAVTPAAVIRAGSLGAAEDESLRRSSIGYLLELSNTNQTGGLALFPDGDVGRLQAEHLFSRGHQRLGYAWPDDGRVSGFATARVDGINAVCAARNVEPALTQTIGLNAATAAAALLAWRDAGVDAIACFNDELALGLIHAAHAAGVSIPDDLGLIGVDNLPWGAFTEPALTTVAPNAERIGGVITEHVVAGLKGSPPPDVPQNGFVELIVREST